MRKTFSLIGLLLLTSCGGGMSRTSSDSGMKHGAAAEDLTAHMELRIIEEKEQEWTLGIFIENPQEIPIQSIRSWVQFDPETLHVKDLSIADSRFSLFAPGERTIDLAEGLIKLGAAALRPIHDTEIFFASFSVRAPALSEKPIISFYDWRADGEGHTAVLTLSEDAVLNVLNIPPSLKL